MATRQLSLCVALATAHCAATAQSSVRVYGILDTSVSVVNHPGARSVRVNSGDLQTSRLGIDAVEDLGGGLRANMSLLAGVGVDAGTVGSRAQFFNLGSSLGLSGPWGSVDAGYLRNSMIFVPFSTDLSGYGLANYGSTSMLHHHNVTGSGIGGFYANTVRYRSPNFSGLRGELSYSLGEESGALKKNGSFAAGNMQYTSGPLYLGIGYTRTRSRSTTLDIRYEGVVVGGYYDFGPVKAGGHWLKTNRPGLAQYGLLLNAKVKLSGNAELDLQAASLREPEGRKSRSYSMGYTFHLSKRTDLYAYALRLENNRFGTRGLWYYGQATVPAGRSSWASGVGMRHAF